MEEILTTILACSLVYGVIAWFAIKSAYWNGTVDGWNAHQRKDDPLYREIRERQGKGSP